MNKTLKFILSLPKTIVFNLKYLPFRQAVKLPIFVTYRTKMMGGGKIILSKCSFGTVRIGYHEVPICNSNDETKIIIDGRVYIAGLVRLGNGTKIRVASTGQLSIGENFHISASSAINCYCDVRIGNNVLVGWNCLIMDTDAHPIFDADGKVANTDSSIIISDHVWIGSNSTILKGSVIPSDCVVGFGSIVSGKKFDDSTIIVGNPAHSIKKISNWEEYYSSFHSKQNIYK